MSEARTGRRVPNFFRGTPTEYNYLHRAVEVVRGKPQVCYICQATDPRFIYEWANLTGDYGNVEDYRRLCKSCHSKFDQGRSIK